MRTILLFAVFITFTSLLFPQPSVSKNITDNDTVSATFQLNQIIITATRAPEKLMDVPFAVSIISRDGLKDKKGYGLDEVLSSVPGVLAQSRSGNQDIRISIRGFGARGSGDRSNAGTSRGIRILLDGFPETEPDGRTSFDQLDLNLSDRIEIIRSNASALWGNGSGGLVNVSSVPSENITNASLSGSGGSFGYSYSALRTNYSLENGNIFASVSNTSFDGWREHSASSRTNLNVGINSNLGEASRLAVFLTAVSNSFKIPGPLTLDQFNSNAKQSNASYAANDERRFNRIGRIGVTFAHDLNDNNNISASVFVSPKFLQRSERNSFRDFTRYYTGGNLLYRNSSELAGFKNNFTAGADESYQDGAILFYNLLKPYNTRGSLKDNKREGANSFGSFIQNEIVTGRLNILLGLRYDNLTYYNENYMGAVTKTDTRSFEKLTPKFGITYRLSPLQSIYFNYGGGIEVPAGNETDPSGTYGQDTVYLINPLLDPVVSTTYEAGIRHIIPVNSSVLSFITYDAALYYIDVRNDIIPYQGGKFYFTAGRTSRKGIELGLTLLSASGIKVDGSLTWSANKYEDYEIDSVHYNKPGRYADLKNNKVAGLPDYFYNTSFTYQPRFLQDLYLTVNFSGVGKYFADDMNKVEVPSYDLINLSLGITQINLSSHFFLKGFIGINNITDLKYAASSFINPDRDKQGRPMYLEAGLPRNYILSVSLGVK